MRRPSVLQINAIVLAVGLTGSYVWFRAAQAEQHRDRVLPGSKLGRVRVDHPAGVTTSTSPALLPGSKSFLLTEPVAHDRAANAAQPATPPATTSKAVFFGSKSGPVDLSRAIKIDGSAEPPVVLGDPTVTTTPASQPTR